jgi:hypothetical protein
MLVGQAVRLEVLLLLLLLAAAVHLVPLQCRRLAVQVLLLLLVVLYSLGL